MLRRTLGDGYSLLCHRSPDRKPDAFDSQRDNAARERLVKLSQSKETTAAVQSALGKLIDQHSIMENVIAEIGIGIENSPFPATPEDIKFTEYSGKELCFTYDCRKQEQKPVCALGFFRVMSHVFLRLVAIPDSPLLSPYIKQHRTIRYGNHSDPDVAILPTEFVPRSVDCQVNQLPQPFIVDCPSLLVAKREIVKCEVSSIY
jgi:hypothetical protein